MPIQAASAELFNQSQQIAVQDDALNIPYYLKPNSVSLIWTSPPYANLLNRERKNKSRRDRKNEQLGVVEQYSQDERDLGTMPLDTYQRQFGDIFEALLPLLKPKGHCVINVPDMWWENKRITIHIAVVEGLRRRGYELRNTVIWDRTNIVNNVGIFGWPSNYITMGTTFEYLLDFWRPPLNKDAGGGDSEDEQEAGIAYIEFDASDTRNHGTKIRLKRGMLNSLYDYDEKIV